jgi:hypothetical protein
MSGSYRRMFLFKDLKLGRKQEKKNEKSKRYNIYTGLLLHIALG